MFLRLAGILGFLAVAAGAFGAHGLKGRLSAEMMEVFEVGVRYHLPHAVALLFVAGVADRSRRARIAGYAFVAGVAVFSGSLYVLAITGVRWLGAVTPIGGVLLLVGWVMLVLAAPDLAGGGVGEGGAAARAGRTTR